MGPAVIVTVGVLFLLQEMRSGGFDLSNTFPFILIVIGAVLLASATAPMTGHVDATTVPPATPPGTPGPPQNPAPGQGR
jgi:membrane-bound ClpP family serine protease